MNKISKYLTMIIFFAGIFVSCSDYKDNFDDARPKNLLNLKDTIQSADFQTIVAGLNANKNSADSALAKRLSTDKMFTEGDDVTKCIPFVMDKKYYSADFQSSCFVTYDLKNDTDTISKTEQYIMGGAYRWVFEPTIRISFTKGKNPTDDYMILVNYVKNSPLYTQNAKLVNSYGDAEYYYGFNGNYGNITYREKDRVTDSLSTDSYRDQPTAEAKLALMDKRTDEALQIYLTSKFPDAKPLVNGIEQKAELTVVIFSMPGFPSNTSFTYFYKCTGDKQWEFLNRTEKK